MLRVLRLYADPGVTNRDPDAGALVVAPGQLRDMQPESTPVWHGLDRVSDQVQKDLLKLNRKTLDHSSTSVLSLQNGVVDLQSPRLQFENVSQQLGNRDLDRMLRLTIDAQRLSRDVGKPKDLLFAHLRVEAGFSIARGMISQKI